MYAKQVSNIAGKRPWMVIKANPGIGVATDIVGIAPAGTGWVKMGPLAVTATHAGVLYVELWNKDTDTFNSPAFFDLVDK
jgi:hypothetical protein